MTATLAEPERVLREADDGSTYWEEIDPIDQALNDNQALEYVDGRFVEKTVSDTSAFVGNQTAARVTVASNFGRLARVYGSDQIYRCWPDRPKHSRRPDGSVVRLDRWAEFVRSQEKADPGELGIVPDLAVEVVSPKDTAGEVAVKIEDYLAAGFPLIWLIHPEARVATVYAGGVPRRVTERDELTLPGLLPAFRHALADLLGPAVTAAE